MPVWWCVASARTWPIMMSASYWGTIWLLISFELLVNSGISWSYQGSIWTQWFCLSFASRLYTRLDFTVYLRQLQQQKIRFWVPSNTALRWDWCYIWASVQNHTSTDKQTSPLSKKQFHKSQSWSCTWTLIIRCMYAFLIWPHFFDVLQADLLSLPCSKNPLNRNHL